MKIFTLILVCAFPCITSANEPWMYPLAVGPNPSLTELNSQSLRINYVEFGGVRISDCSSRAVDADVASFDAIVKWYSDKLGSTDLTGKLASYNSRAEEAPDSQHGQVIGPTASAPTILYRFTPAHKQITIVPPIDDGDIVAVSLHGTNAETRIQVVRRHPNRKGR